MLGIEFPLLAFSHCRDVVAAVTNAGGFGVLGASSHSPEDLEHELAWIDDQVGGKPYGVDIVCPEKFEGKGLDLTKVGAKHDKAWIADHIRDAKKHNPMSRMEAYPEAKLNAKDLDTLSEYLAGLK